MTPIRGFLRKILGAPTHEPPKTTPSDASRGESGRDRSASARPGDRGDATPDEGERSEGSRRRGRRGGRGRGRSGETAPIEARAPEPGRGDGGNRGPAAAGAPGAAPVDQQTRAYSWGSRAGGGEADDQARQRRQQASQQRRGRSFRPVRENLDAPLPEDIAFRSGTEGGDRTIFPSRRRRPTGLRDTERVIVGGARTLSGWARPFTPPEPTVPEEAEHEEPETPARNRTPEPRPTRPRVETRAVAEEEPEDGAEARVDVDVDVDASEETAEGGAPRRRRGRRGGRGRRRPETAGEGDGAVLAVDTSALDHFDHNDDDMLAPVDEVEAIEAIDEVDTDDDGGEPRIAAAPRREASRAPRTPERPSDDVALPEAFAELGLSERSLRTLAGFGYTEPTPIQVRAIPALLNGRDVVGVAQTGSGKTVAFGVPMMEALDRDLPEVQGLVLVPTRELAQQVLEVLSDLARPWAMEAVGILGGHSLARDFKALERRPAIVVGTPGRVIDHLGRGTLSLRHVSYAVLDEADQMLDIGFLPDIRRILSRTPKHRQTALFSATMPSTIRRLIWQFMEDPETVTVDRELSTVDSIEQIYFEVAARDKARGLRELVERELKGRTLVFCKMKRGVDRLEADLARQGVRVGALHGDMDQRRRDRVVQEFRAGDLDILIATNVAARGLDIPEITHVVNYDVPQNVEEYIHRIGRTGRMGREGRAITFVSEWDVQEWDVIARHFGDQIRRDQLAIYSA